MLLQPKALLFLTAAAFLQQKSYAHAVAHAASAISEDSSSSDSADVDMNIDVEQALDMSLFQTEESFLSLTPEVSSVVHALRSDFVAWKDRHEKVYQSVKEELHRMLVWIENHGTFVVFVLGNEME